MAFIQKPFTNTFSQPYNPTAFERRQRGLESLTTKQEPIIPSSEISTLGSYVNKADAEKRKKALGGFESVSENFLLPLLAVAEVIGTKGKSGGEAALTAQKSIASERQRQDTIAKQQQDKQIAEQSLAELANAGDDAAKLDTWARKNMPEKAYEGALARIKAKMESEQTQQFDVTTPEGADAYRQNLARTSPQDYLKLEGEREDQLASQANKMRSEFNGLSKDHKLVADSYARIKASASDPSAAGDLSMIFNYMKVLDPGSTVREGEFATAQNAAGIPQRVRNIFNRAMSGERLAPEQREDFVNRAGKLFNAQESRQQENIDRYNAMAERAGIDPLDVTGNASINKEQQAPKGQYTGQTVVDDQGNRATWNGSTWIEVKSPVDTGGQL
jgi:hypothetical protein